MRTRKKSKRCQGSAYIFICRTHRSVCTVPVEQHHGQSRKTKKDQVKYYHRGSNQTSWRKNGREETTVSTPGFEQVFEKKKKKTAFSFFSLCIPTGFFFLKGKIQYTRLMVSPNADAHTHREQSRQALALKLTLLI